MRFGLQEETISKIQKVFSHFSEVQEVIIYGSRAMGNFKPGSDIDLCLKGPEITLSVQNKIANELDDILLPYTFDLSIFSKLEDQNFVNHINEKGVSFYLKV